MRRRRRTWCVKEIDKNEKERKLKGISTSHPRVVTLPPFLSFLSVLVFTCYRPPKEKLRGSVQMRPHPRIPHPVRFLRWSTIEGTPRENRMGGVLDPTLDSMVTRRSRRIWTAPIRVRCTGQTTQPRCPSIHLSVCLSLPTAYLSLSLIFSAPPRTAATCRLASGSHAIFSLP